jgi:hypothetical protein
MDVYYKIEPENLAEVAKLTAKDLNWSNKNTNYRTSVVVKDGNGKTLAVNTDYKLNYYIETFEREKPETPIYKLINECLGTKVIVGYKNGNPVEVEINAKGKIVLTEKAIQLGVKYRNNIELFEETVEKNLTEEEIITLKNILNKISANIADMKTE